MNTRQIILSFILLDFAIFSGWVVYHYGYIEIFQWAFTNGATLQLFTDLVLSLGLVSTWMVMDARKNGMSVLPYLLVTLLLGSMGPLLYLIRRERVLRGSSRDPQPLGAAPARS